VDFSDGGFREWMEFGMRKGWIAHPVCGMHDSLPMSPQEVQDFEDGEDHCIPVMRIWRQAMVG
jgi:hypothetical protein